MIPTWAIQTNAVSRLQADAVASAVTSQGGKVIEVEVLPSTNTIIALHGAELNTKDIIPYGSTKLVELAIEKEWTGVFRNSNFSVPIWKEQREDMLNGDSVSILAEKLPAFTIGLPDDTVLFIRPTIGKKLFPGQTATVTDILSWLRVGQVGKYPFLPDTEIALATNKVIIAETRWFVVNGKVISGSTYRLHDQRVLIPENNENNLIEAQQFANIWLPHSTCVMDLALTDEGIKVIEFNTFNSSGFYHHDIPKIVNAVHEMIRAS